MTRTTSLELSFPSGNHTLPAFYTRPEGSGPFPAVVVIHEIFGLNDSIRSVAERFAGAGYAALAVDLYGKGNRAFCMARLIGGMLLHSLDHVGIDDLKAALSFLAEQPEVDAERLGAIGFCMGGGLAIAWACTDERLGAVAPFYGMNPRPLEAVKRSCPVVGSYPEKDPTKAQGEKLAAKLETYNVPHDIKVYGGAKHSFFNDQGRAYDAAASADAWRRTLTFFAARLGETTGDQGETTSDQRV